MVCRCGAVLSNTRSPCPTEGSLCGEADEATAFEDACKDVAAFFAAVRNDARDGWIAGFFSPDYPVVTRDEEVVCDVIAAHTRRVSLSHVVRAFVGAAREWREPLWELRPG